MSEGVSQCTSGVPTAVGVAPPPVWRGPVWHCPNPPPHPQSPEGEGCQDRRVPCPCSVSSCIDVEHSLCMGGGGGSNMRC